jgi:peptide/nickel transport system substrate-binding protein
MRTMTKAFLLSGSALLSAGLFMTSLPSAAMAQEATFALPAGELGATSYNPVTSATSIRRPR